MTLATDYVLGALSIALGIAVFRFGRVEGQRSRSTWGAALLTSGLGALAGGTYHGLLAIAPPLALSTLWRATSALIGIASFLLVAATAMATTAHRIARLLIGLALLMLILYSYAIATRDDFLPVVVHYGISMLFALALVLFAWRRAGGAAPWIVGGIAVSAAAAAVQLSGFSLHRHFTHNDLYHVIQMAATWCFYRGGRLLRDTPAQQLARAQGASGREM